mmetsp:Transcript_6711/g.14897  ORF Transcript_6711/g.14897 Transcript_6711/m.14897 type:complete len:101 (+) Transcript_6711:2537-2839(+)
MSKKHESTCTMGIFLSKVASTIYQSSQSFPKSFSTHNDTEPPHAAQRQRNCFASKLETHGSAPACLQANMHHYAQWIELYITHNTTESPSHESSKKSKKQ